MKYRFRPSGKKRGLPISANTVFRLKGRDLPKRVKNLPEARERIDFSDTGKKRSLDFGSVKKALKRLWARIAKISRKFASALGVAFCKTRASAARAKNKFLKKKSRKESKERSVNSLPLFAGAMTASFLVCAVSILYMVFGLFAFYGRSYRTVTVPNTVGSLYSELENLGDDFTVTVKSVNNPNYPDGTVISQSPPAGVTRRIYKDQKTCKITVTVSKSKKLTVPDGILGSSERDALLLLKNAGISYKVTRVYSEQAANTVTSVLPASGASLSDGEAVTLTVSLGKRADTVFMPDLSGISESEAAEQLSGLGLDLERVVYVASSQRAGTVTSQSIMKNTSVPKGTKVSITVSLGR